MSPLLSRDDALALARAIGSVVVLDVGGVEVRGSLIGVDAGGNAIVQTSFPIPDSAVGDYTKVPVSLVNAWRIAP